MESASSLSEALFKTSSLLKSLLSQVGGSSGNNALDGMFSSLVSGGLGASASGISSSGSARPSEGSSARASSTASWMQTTADLKATLHQALATLKQKAPVAGKSNAADGQTHKAAPQTEPPPSQAAQEREPDETAATAEGASAPLCESAERPPEDAGVDLIAAQAEAAQKADAELSEILAELLALVQLVLQALMQMQGQGGTALQASALPEEGAFVADGAGASATEEDADALESAPLMELLKTVEKNVQAFLKSGKDVASDASMEATLADTAQQLAQLDSRMEEIVALLHGQSAQRLAEVRSDYAPEAKSQPAALTAPAAALEGTGMPAPGAAASAIALPASGLGHFSAEADVGSGGKGFSFAAGHGASAANASAEGAQATGTYTFTSTLSAFRAVNGGTTGLPSVVDQVVIHLNRGVKNGQSHVTVQLQPGDLGKITVKLDFDREGKVQGTVTADNPKTLDMLQKDSRSLERALQDAGLRADPGSLQFSLRQGDQNHLDQSNAYAEGAKDRPAEETLSQAELVDIGALSESYYLTPTGVNIRV